MNYRKAFILATDRVRDNAMAELRRAARFAVVIIAPPTRSNEQNSKLHAMLTDLAASPVTWAGKRRTMEEWKALVISGHAVATQHPGEVVPGLEGEFVAIRESSASMSVARCASLITYLQAFGDANGVVWRKTEEGGWLEPREAAA